MAFIDTKTGEVANWFSTVNGHEMKKRIIESGRFIEVDEFIAPTLELLNKAGYKTKYSCSQHALPEVLGYLNSGYDYIQEKKGHITLCGYILFEDSRFYDKFISSSNGVKVRANDLRKLTSNPKLFKRLGFINTNQLIFEVRYEKGLKCDVFERMLKLVNMHKELYNFISKAI